MPRKKRRERGTRGEGYVTWDKSKSRYKAAWPLGNGKYRTAHVYREEDAQAWLADRKREVEANLAIGSAQQPFETWLALCTANRSKYLRLTTQDYYAACCQYANGALPENIALNAVTVDHIATMDQTLRASLSAHRCNIILWLVEKALYIAERREIITKNPATIYRETTTARERGGKEPKKVTALSIEECQRLIAVAMQDRMGILCLLMLTLPLRLGEVIGLRWTDLDLTRGELAIAQQITNRADGRQMDPSEPKSDSGVRHLPTTPRLVSGLRGHADRAIGEGWPTHGLVFSAAHGQKLYPRRVRWLLNKWGKQAGIEHVHPHMLRHTVLTHLAGLGADITIVGAFAGHSVQGTTAGYIHHPVSALRPWVLRWERALEGPENSSQTGT